MLYKQEVTLSQVPGNFSLVAGGGFWSKRWRRCGESLWDAGSNGPHTLAGRKYELRVLRKRWT